MGSQGYHTMILLKKNYIIHRNSRTFPKQIFTSSITWITIFVRNPSELRQTCCRHIQTSLLLRHLFFFFFFTTRYSATEGTLAKVSGWRWLLFWRVTVCQICCLTFSSNSKKKRQRFTIYIYPCSLYFLNLRVLMCFCQVFEFLALSTSVPIEARKSTFVRVFLCLTYNIQLKKCYEHLVTE